MEYQYQVVKQKDGRDVRVFGSVNMHQNKVDENDADHSSTSRINSVMNSTTNSGMISCSYEFQVPWYLQEHYRMKHQLSLKDLKDMLSGTPIPILCVLALGIGTDPCRILTQDTLTDHSWESLSQWQHQYESRPPKTRYTNNLFNDDTRLLTAVVNILYQYLEYEYAANKIPWTQAKCICPYDTHVPLLPVHLVATLPFNPVITSEELGLADDPSHQWRLHGPFHGYQKWQSAENPYEYILIQTHGGHNILQHWEEDHKKRKDMYLLAWSDKALL